MKDKYQFAQQIVREAGEFLREHVKDELHIEEKSDFTDLVTHLDKQVQSDLTEAILERYPEDCIFGEESQNPHPIADGRVWVIDPIDGTANFVAQRNDFSILLAYFEEGVGQFGVIYDVMAKKLYHGGRVFPPCENGKPLTPYREIPLHRGLVGINAALYAQNHHGISDFANQTLGTRCNGSAGVSFSHLFTGRLMAYVGYIHPWDYAAASIIGEPLGYSLLTLTGEQPNFVDRQQVMMIPTAKLEEVKRYLN